MNESLIQEISIDLIDLGDNVRQSCQENADVGIASSIDKAGVITPIEVVKTDERYQLVFGFRRLRGARRAGLKTIPAMIVDRPMSAEERLLRQLTENIQRQDLNLVEKARGIELYIRRSNCSASEAAKGLGLSNTEVSNLRSLLSLPQNILDAVESSEIGPSAAFELARVNGCDEQAKLAAEIANGRLTRDELVGRLRSKRNRKNSQLREHSSTRTTALLGSGRSITISGPDLSLEKLIEWLEELLAKARKSRPQGLSLNTFTKMLRDQAKS